MVQINLKACGKCGGDLKLDENEWRCWQCGHAHYTAVEMSRILEAAKSPPNPPKEDQPSKTKRRGGRAYGSVGDHNRQIERRNRAEKHFWEKNKEVIRLFDEGLTLKEVAAIDGRGERRLDVVRREVNARRALKVGDEH